MTKYEAEQCYLYNRAVARELSEWDAADAVSARLRVGGQIDHHAVATGQYLADVAEAERRPKGRGYDPVVLTILG